MSNYTKTVDFAAKDGLTSGASGKIIKGTEFETEFDNIVTAIATKADLAGPTFTGTATFATLSDGTIAVTAFADEDDMSSNSATLVPTQQSVKAYVDSQAGDMQFVLEDGDGTEVQVTKDKEVKFVEGGGVDINWTDTDNGTDGDPYDLTFTINAAQTGITSIYATDLILGEDAETAIDFGTANEIDFKADNAARLTLTASALYPVTNNQIDLGTASLEFKDAFFDGTVTADAFAGPFTGALTGNADTATTATNVTASANNATDETVYPTFVDGATGTQGIETDTGLTYNPSTGLLTTAELSATTLDIGGTNITSTATEINQLDALTRGSILYGNASAVTTRLAAGSANQVLTSDGTDISWAAAGGAYSTWIKKTADGYTASDGDQIICVHATTAFTVTLPSGTTAFRTVTISNIGAATVTVGRNSQPINSTASDATLLSNRSTQLVYVDSTIGWKELP